MKLSEIQDMWKDDCKINMTNLGAESGRSPELHAKYLQLLTRTRLTRRKTYADLIRLKQLKGRFYRGELSKETLDANGWQPYLFNKPLKNEMDEFLLSDADIMVVVDKLEYLDTMLFQLEQIIRSLNSRNWDIKNAIDWTKFTQGA